MDVTRACGVSFRYASDLRRGRSLATVGGGVAAADLDGDGLAEIFFTGSVRDGRFPGRGPRAALYWNRGDGTFEERAGRRGVEVTGWEMGAHFADLDADGLPDLLITASGEVRVYRNLGGGVLSPVPRAGGITGGRWSVGAAFLDADSNGLLDVYIGNYLDTDYAKEQSFPMFQVRTPDDYEGLPNTLSLQLPDGSFSNAPVSSGVVATGSKTLGACAHDFDGDGIDDLFVANDRSPNLLFRGRGDGTFEDVSAASGIEEIAGRTGPRAGMGIGVGDPDGDGDPDLVVTNFAGEPVTFYRNSGNGVFEDATEESGLRAGTWPYVQWGVQFEDLDNDGNPDLPIISGHLVPRILTVMASLFRKGGAGPYGRGRRSYRQPAVLYRGLGDGRFEDVTASSEDFGRMHISGRGSACADYDGDGLLDLAVSAVSGGVRILRNATEGAGHAIELLPEPGSAPSALSPPDPSSHDEGRQGLLALVHGLLDPALSVPSTDQDRSNVGRRGPHPPGVSDTDPARTTVVGTRVVVTAGSRRWAREFSVLPSYASGSWLPLHFGLGAASSADRIEVFRPGEKRPSAVYTNIPASGLYALTPSGIRLVRPFHPRSQNGNRRSESDRPSSLPSK